MVDFKKIQIKILEKAIVPKFKVGQEIWHILCNDGVSSVVMKDVITNIKDNIYSLKKCRFCATEKELFTTEQEAIEKLKKEAIKEALKTLKGEIKNET